ncbi:MAG: hypothetical protein KAK00_00830 [Nanoarchaeota archaeon]|nr:hypothetical protein [Nanoarchaeota archaeon]
MANKLYLSEFFQSLDHWGITDVMLPFLLVFTIIFAVLEKTKILGMEKKNFNVVIALVLGLSVVIPHVTDTYPLSYDPVELINEVLPSVSILVVAIIMLLIVIGVFAHDKVFLGLSMPGWVGFFSVTAILLIFGSAAGWWDNGFSSTLENFFGEDAVAIVIMILVFGIIIAFITGEDKGEKVSALQKMGINLGELFGKR